MNLSKLDGFGRVPVQTPMQFQGNRKKAKRHARRNPNRPFKVRPVQANTTPGLDRPAWVKDIRGSNPKTKRAAKQSTSSNTQSFSASHAKTKRAAKQAKQARYNQHLQGKLSSGAEPNIGFSRVYQDNQPASEALQGFNRIRYTNKELQGLSLQGHAILQGYAGASEDDIEDWNYLLSIEHPETLQGFPTWVLNGRAERKARQAARKAKRAARDKEKAAKRTGKSAKKAARRQKRTSRQTEKKKRKEIRTAKKEERLQKKVRRREGREERKADRIANKATRKQERQLTKRMRQEAREKARAARGGKFADTFSQLTDSGMQLASDIMTGDNDFEDYSYNDFDSQDFGGGFNSFLEDQSLYSGEEALQTRESALDLLEPIDEEEFVLDSWDKPEGEGSNMMMPLILLGGAALMMSQKKGKKKKK